MKGTDLAPAGTVWVCECCGKRSRTRYGFDVEDQNVSDPGWGEGCMTWALLCDTEQVALDPQPAVEW